MNIEEMIQKKKEIGYSNQQIADISGVPLGTVQKIFSGITTAPRYQTLQALAAVFEKDKMEDDMFMEKASYSYGTTARKYNDGQGDKRVEDYLAIPDNERVELIDGVFYDMTAPTTVHQRIGFLLGLLFERYIDSNGGKCIPFVAPTDVQLDSDDKTMVQPDVFVVCDRSKIIKARVVGAPDLVIEVLSPNNWYMDIYRKKAKYEKAGVREYWIILPDEKKVHVYNFEASSDFIEYTFMDKIPVAIWDNKLEIDFKKQIYDKISFMLD